MLSTNTYTNLEDQFRNQVLVDNQQYGYKSVYLPNIPPKNLTKYILVAMEPSLGRWAKSAEEAQNKIDTGFKNFAYSIEDFILHFCIRRYLCPNNETYYLTDISKGAMMVADAKAARQDRYNCWYPLLEAELDAVSMEETSVIFIGKSVEHFLNCKELRNYAGTILHHSSLASRYRNDVILHRENEFKEFARTVTLDSILKTAESVLLDARMDPFLDETLTRIRKTNLNDSKKKLLFTYKVSFEEIRQTGHKL